MALPGIPIPETQCIGDSLFSINNALTALDSSVIELINAGASVTVSTTAPGGASLGDLWYDSDNGILSVYYDLQWVDVGAGGGGGGITDVTGTAPITVTGTDVKNVSINSSYLTNPWLYKNSAYTAVNNDRIAANTSGGAFTITLPASPAYGTNVTFIDEGKTWDTNNLTIARNGSTIEGLAENFIVNATGDMVMTMFYNGSTWRVYV